MNIINSLLTIFTLVNGSLSIPLSLNSTYMNKYNSFIEKYNKEFSFEKFEIFKENVKFINYHNDNNYNLEINKFADEITNNDNIFTKKQNPNIIIFNNDTLIPLEKDWRKENAVTSVKNQGNCGSCWAFSTTGSIEGIVSIKTGELFNISEQELVDCSSDYGNNGCEGGLMDNGFKYVIDNGLCSEKEYPYEAVDGNCKRCKTVVEIKNYHDIESNEKVLKRAVSQQPVSVAIQANLSSFRFYSNGVYSDPMCGDGLDHGILIVGYGYDLMLNKEYWIVKNSWGEDWGENGYIRIERNSNKEGGMCGITLQASIPEL